MVRVLLTGTCALFLLTPPASAGKYESVTYKKTDKGLLTFEDNDKEIKLALSGGFKSFDQDGKELGANNKDISGLGDKYRIFKEGNVVDLTTVTKNNKEWVTEIRLVKGELAKAGKLVEKGDKSAPKEKKPAAEMEKKPVPKDEKPAAETKTPKTQRKQYKNATILSIERNKVVLQVKDDQVTVTANRSMRAYDAKGKQLKGKAEAYRVLKEGNEVSVTTQKDSKKETIVTIRLIKGELEEKD